MPRRKFLLSALLLSACGLMVLLAGNPAEMLISWRGSALLGVFCFGAFNLAESASAMCRVWLSEKVIEELTVTTAKFCAWEERTKLPTNEEDYFTGVVYGSEVEFEGIEEKFLLPTRHLRTGDKTRRLLFKWKGKVWAYRWLDI